ncbi:hypothetical protein AMJ86_00335 [bacterium SM23_57]|nr:MAG: hypothetical protein AMJ86_00335 [bacterium SM23_57]
MDGQGLANYFQNLRSPRVFLILTLLILFSIISPGSLLSASPTIRSSFKPHQQYRFQRDLENLDQSLIWNQTYNMSPYDRGYAIVQCQGGGFALFGETEDSQLHTDLLLIRVDSFGNVLWNLRYDYDGNEQGIDFVECLDGGFALVGYKPGEMFLVRTNSMGTPQWYQTFDSIPSCIGASIVHCYTGGFAILCNVYNEETLLLRLDEEGVLLWFKIYETTLYDQGDTLVECHDGGFAFTGTSDNANTPDVMLFRTDAEGNLLWNQTYGTRGYYMGLGLVECEDGGFAFTGYIQEWGSSGSFIWLVRTDAIGVLMWNHTYGDGFGHSILQTRLGAFAITGSISGVITSYSDVVFYVINSSGQLILNWRLGGPYSQVGNSIIECHDGGFAIVGQAYDQLFFSDVLMIRIPGVEGQNLFQRIQWYGVVIVLPILVSVIIVILTIWVFKSKNASLHKKKLS